MALMLPQSAPPIPGHTQNPRHSCARAVGKCDWAVTCEVWVRLWLVSVLCCLCVSFGCDFWGEVPHLPWPPPCSCLSAVGKCPRSAGEPLCSAGEEREHCCRCAALSFCLGPTASPRARIVRRRDGSSLPSQPPGARSRDVGEFSRRPMGQHIKTKLSSPRVWAKSPKHPPPHTPQTVHHHDSRVTPIEVSRVCSCACMNTCRSGLINMQRKRVC